MNINFIFDLFSTPSRADLRSQHPFGPAILQHNLQGGILVVLGAACFWEYCTVAFGTLLENKDSFSPVALSFLFIFYRDFPLTHTLSLYYNLIARQLSSPKSSTKPNYF